jgi:hypothetical protein
MAPVSKEQLESSLVSVLNKERLENVFLMHKNDLVAEIESATNELILSNPTSRVLAVIIRDSNEIITFNPSVRYCKALYAGMKNKEFEGSVIDFLISSEIADLIGRKIEAFYSNSEMIEAYSTELCLQFKELNSILDTSRRVASSAIESTKKQALSNINESGHRHMVSQAGAASAQAIMVIAGTAIGQHLIVLLKSFLVSSTGKAMLHQIAYAVSHTTLSAGMKLFVGGFIKKAGLAALLHSKVGGVIMGVIGVMALPIVIVLVPLIAKIQWDSFPEKLAKKITPEVGYSIDKEFPDLNKRVVGELVNATIKEILKNYTPQEEVVNSKDSINIMFTALAIIGIIIVIAMLL